MKKTILTTALIVALTAGMAQAYGGRGWSDEGPRGQGFRQGGQWGQGMMMQQGPGMRGPGFKRGGGDGFGRNDCPMFGAGSFDNAVRQQFLDDTVELRKQAALKRFELREAQRKADTTPEQLAAIQKELIDLRAQIDTKAQALLKPAS